MLDDDDDDDDDDDGGGGGGGGDDDGLLWKKWNMNRFSAWQSHSIYNLLSRILSICTFSVLALFFFVSYLHKARWTKIAPTMATNGFFKP